MKPDKSTLETLYLSQQLSTDAIGVRYGVHKTTVYHWLTKHGIPKAGCRTRIRPSKAILEDLYLTQRMTQQEIASLYKVDRTNVSAWLSINKIPTRFFCKGLKFRGQEAPSRETLYWLIHIAHERESDVGARFGVSHTTIRKWLIRLNIEPPLAWATKRKGMPDLPNGESLHRMYEIEGMSLRWIASLYGVSPNCIKSLCRKHGVVIRPQSWNGIQHIGNDGHRIKSDYEKRVCDWLTERGVAHIYEPRLLATRYFADFLVSDTYIEVWGMDYPEYNRRKQIKKQIYLSASLPLIEITPAHFTRNVWQKRLAPLLRLSSSRAA